MSLTRKERKNVFSAVFTIIVLGAMTPLLISPYANYKEFYLTVNQIPFTHISNGEYDAGQWLRTNINIKQFPNSYLISDYATSNIMRGLTGLNSTAGRHPNISPERWNALQESVKTVFSSPVGNHTYTTLDTIRKDTQSNDLYLVFSSRTCWWINQQDVNAIRYLPMPSSYTIRNYCPQVETMALDYKFTPIFQNAEVIIFKYESY